MFSFDSKHLVVVVIVVAATARVGDPRRTMALFKDLNFLLDFSFSWKLK